HLLENAVMRRGRIVGLLYGVAVFFCGAALWVAFTGELNGALVLLALEFVVVLAMRTFGLAAGAQRLAAAQRQEARRTLARMLPVEGQLEDDARPSAAVKTGDLADS